jgi:hypothetical protein
MPTIFVGSNFQLKGLRGPSKGKSFTEEIHASKEKSCQEKEALNEISLVDSVLSLSREAPLEGRFHWCHKKLAKKCTRELENPVVSKAV